jgi:hypothetical protein
MEYKSAEQIKLMVVQYQEQRIPYQEQRIPLSRLYPMLKLIAKKLEIIFRLTYNKSYNRPFQKSIQIIVDPFIKYPDHHKKIFEFYYKDFFPSKEAYTQSTQYAAFDALLKLYTENCNFYQEIFVFLKQKPTKFIQRYMRRSKDILINHLTKMSHVFADHQNVPYADNPLYILAIKKERGRQRRIQAQKKQEQLKTKSDAQKRHNQENRKPNQPSNITEVPKVLSAPVSLSLNPCFSLFQKQRITLHQEQGTVHRQLLSPKGGNR